jgi:hypothetical protein
MTGFIRFPRARRGRSGALLVGSVLLLAAFHPTLCSAQSDDAPTEETPPPATPPKAPVYTFHGHGGGGGDDGAGRSGFRDDRGPNSGMRLESTAGLGLALDHSTLPGELGRTPETRTPLFAKPTDGLTLRPDPWDPSAK